MSYYSQHYQNAKLWGVDRFYWQTFFGKVTGTILDIGCSTGRYMELARTNNQKIQGIDIDSDALAIASKRGLEAKFGNIEQRLNFSANTFDAIHFHAVIEHLTNPLIALKECYRLLVPGGILVCLTMNIDRCGKRFWSMDYTHRTPFSRKSLEMIAIDAGFKEIEILYEPSYVLLSKHLPADLFFVLNIWAYKLGWQKRDKIILTAKKDKDSSEKKTRLCA